MTKRFEGKNTLRKLLCAALALIMLCTPLAATAAEGETQKATLPIDNVETPPEGYTTLVVASRHINSGARLGENHIKTVIVSKKNLPVNAITDARKALGFYATVDFYEGEYITSDQLSVAFKAPFNSDVLVSPLVTVEDADSIVVTDYIMANTGEDLAGPLQRLIDKNAGKTLIFPDGEYVISYPLITQGLKAKCNSFLFSPGAVLKAADGWNGMKYRNAMICMGESVKGDGDGAFISGGTFMCNGKADGISVFSGVDSYIDDVTIVNPRIGLDIQDGIDSGESRWRVTNVNILGLGSVNGIGVQVYASANYFSNVRVSNMRTGVGIYGKNNVVDSCYVENGDNGEYFATLSGGFCDNGGNTYIRCSVTNCFTAYQLGNDVTFIDNMATWNTATYNNQIALKFTGKASPVVGFKAIFFGERINPTFMTWGGGTKQGPLIFGCSSNRDFGTRYNKYQATPIVVVAQ